MIRAVVRSLFVVCVLAGVGLVEPGTAAAAPAMTHVAKKHAHHHKLKRKARKAKRRHRRHHHRAKKHAAPT